MNKMESVSGKEVAEWLWQLSGYLESTAARIRAEVPNSPSAADRFKKEAEEVRKTANEIWEAH